MIAVIGTYRIPVENMDKVKGPMADVIRAGLTEGVVPNVTRSYLVLGLWSMGSMAVAAAVLGRRK